MAPIGVVPWGNWGVACTLTREVGAVAADWLAFIAVVVAPAIEATEGRALTPGTIKNPTTMGATRRANLERFMVTPGSEA
jgi:hypothetical protein